MEEIKEFELSQVKAVRFRGQIRTLIDTDFVSFKNTKKVTFSNDFVAILKGIESRSIGMVKVALRGDEIFVEGLLDYQSPERLHLENGELTLTCTLSLGAPYDDEVALDDDGKAAPTTVTIRELCLMRVGQGNLKPKEMSWEF